MALADDRGARFEGSEQPFDRQPPQDITAEQSVLGGMLLSKDAIADVVEVLRPGDFYRPAHQVLFDCVLDLYGRGEPADPVTVSAELERRGELLRVGGAPYLHTLISIVPTAANAGYYAEIVAAKGVLRRLVEAGTRIVQLGYHGADGADVDEVVDRAQAAVYEVTERRMSEDYVALEELLQPTMDEIDAIASRGGVSVGVPTGFVDLDAVTGGLHPGQMVIIAARPGIGKSTLGLDFARSCSVRHGMTSVLFSLEMSRTEIVMRLLSAEARIRLSDMRSGRMSDDDWTRLARRMGEISEAPLFIDDSPNMTMMEIRAKARRLRQRHDLRLIVVDYMQLMTSGKKVESRQQEVSEFSRHLKLLAKELEVPVVTISQLNRGPEQRTDKKPMLADLRESGCLIASTRILRADTGAEATLGELLASGERNIPVWSLDERLRLVTRPLTHVFPSGTKQTFRVTLRSGRVVEATANHPFLTLEGWLPLGELTSGSRVAVPRSVPEPQQVREWPEHHVILLAHQIGDGSSIPSHEKFIPDEVFGLPRAQVSLFLRHLWSTDGRIPHLNDTDRRVQIYYATTSRRLADDVARLLLRVGVLARITVARKSGYRDSYHVSITGLDNQCAFRSEVGCHGSRGVVGAQVLEALDLLATNDVFWDEISSIESAGEQPVYDATVLDTHNFVANGIALHNSLEQDADMVMLIHRPDAWERDDPRAGEADLILAKHRNGPTATVTVAHQLHYSRFFDMAQN
ncbi:MAG TPA: replicative DNA helicase [Pseudonocardiaceae bacterium]|nr:replicative DNA helicase [Pseudonocardiaceae bacterium]